MAEKLSIAIVEDDSGNIALLRQCLEAALAEHGLEAGFAEYASGEDFLARYSGEPLSMAFLDIYMNEITGVAVAERIRQKDRQCVIVFCTSSRDSMQEAFSCHAFDYILKPVSPERIRKLLSDVLDYIWGAGEPTVSVKAGGMQVSLQVQDIIEVGTQGHYLTIETVNGQSYTVRMTLPGFQETLPKGNDFLLINRGCLVNLAHVATMHGTQCTLDNGMVLPLKVRSAAELVQQWHSWCFDKLRRGQRVQTGTRQEEAL